MQVVSGDDVVATWTADKPFASLVLSSDAITEGESYTIHLGGTASGTAVGGLSLGGSTTGATELGTVTAGEHSGGRGRP